MSKFKYGEHARVIGVAGTHGFSLGDVVKVAHDAESSMPGCERLSDGEFYYVKNRELGKITQGSQGLKVGDLAKVIAPHDGYAGNGDIVRLYENTGGAYDFKCRKIGDETSRGTLFDAEDLEPYSEEKPLKPGDLAKVTTDKHEYQKGTVVRITEGTPNAFDYYADNLASGGGGCVDADFIEPYTPTEGGQITISGKNYTLEQRKAKVGEKVLIVDADVQLEREYANGDVFTVKEHALLSDIYTEEANRYINYGEYLVLTPQAPSEISEGGDDQYTLIVRDKYGATHEVKSEVGASEFVQLYAAYAVEFIDHPSLWIRVEDIASVAAKGAQ